MKVLKILGIVIAAIVIVALIWIMTLSNEAHLERTITINAPIEKVFAVVNDFGQTKHWNPWMKIDPDAVYTYSDNTVGEGAWYSWTSDHDQVGNGRQDILSSVENENVKTSMGFEGMTGIYTADFILEADGENTNLVWTFDGKADVIGEKIFMAFTDYMLGPSYDEGLIELKSYIENLPEPEPEEELIESDSTIVESDTTVME